MPRMPLASPITNVQGGSFTAQPVAAVANTITARLPPGLTYRAIDILLGIGATPATRAQIVTAVSQIRLLISGQELWVCSGSQLLAIMEFYNGVVSDDVGIISLDFARLFARGSEDALASVLGTADQTSVEIELQFAAAGALTSAQVFYHVSPNPENAGIVRCLRRQTFPAGGPGAVTMSDLLMDRTATLLALYIFPPTIADLSNIKYNADNVQIVNAPRSILNHRAERAWPYRRPQDAAPTAPMACLDFTADGFSGEGIRLADVGMHSLELNFANATAAFQILSELALPLSPAPGVASPR